MEWQEKETIIKDQKLPDRHQSGIWEESNWEERMVSAIQSKGNQRVITQVTIAALQTVARRAHAMTIL